jgi:hypothetical protein
VANSQRGEVRLEVGSKTYTLALDLNAMCELEELLSTPDKPVTFQDIARGLMATRMQYIRAFFWACLRRHHKEVTLKGVSDLMSEAGGLAPFLSKVNALMEMTKPDKGDEAAAAPSRPTRVASPKRSGTGLPSIGKAEKLA